MKNIFRGIILLFFALLLTCEIFDASVTEEKKKNGYELFLRPTYTFFNNGAFFTYYDVTYQFPENRFLIKFYPIKNIQFKIKKAQVQIDRELIDLSVKEHPYKKKFNPDPKRIIYYYNQVLEADKDLFNRMIDYVSDVKIILETEYDQKPTRLVFDLEKVDKSSMVKLMNQIEKIENRNKKNRSL